MNEFNVHKYFISSDAITCINFMVIRFMGENLHISFHNREMKVLQVSHYF